MDEQATHEVHGHTAQYSHIAIALRITLVEYFERAELKAKRGLDLDTEDELSARRLTAVLLTAALCEAILNVPLAIRLSPEDFDAAQSGTVIKKWRTELASTSPTFDFSDANPTWREFQFLIRCRNAIVHAKPEVWGPENTTLHSGNHQSWDDLTHDRLLPLARVPVDLAQALTANPAPFVRGIYSTVAHELFLKELETKAQVIRLHRRPPMPGKTATGAPG